VTPLRVDARVWRSGQPHTDDEWRAVAALGVKRVLKLNEESEGTDAGAYAHGLLVHFVPIADPLARATDPGWRLDAALGALDDEDLDGPWLVHCTQGVDRTGLVVACYRVLRGWKADDALSEWVHLGSHGYRGLLDAWQRFCSPREAHA
jgi:protein tyrosine/serine phosphatase